MSTENDHWLIFFLSWGFLLIKVTPGLFFLKGPLPKKGISMVNNKQKAILIWWTDCVAVKKTKMFFLCIKKKKKKKKEKKEREWEIEKLVHCDRLCQMGQNPFWKLIQVPFIKLFSRWDFSKATMIGFFSSTVLWLWQRNFSIFPIWYQRSIVSGNCTNQSFVCQNFDAYSVIRCNTLFTPRNIK